MPMPSAISAVDAVSFIVYNSLSAIWADSTFAAILLDLGHLRILFRLRPACWAFPLPSGRVDPVPDALEHEKETSGKVVISRRKHLLLTTLQTDTRLWPPRGTFGSRFGHPRPPPNDAPPAKRPPRRRRQTR